MIYFFIISCYKFLEVGGSIKIMKKLNGIFIIKFSSFRVPVVVQRVKNATYVCEDAGSILGPTQWIKDLALLQAVV